MNSHNMLGEFGNSWLRLSEINAALDHQRADRRLLNFETHTILAIMAALSSGWVMSECVWFSASVDCQPQAVSN